MFTKINNLKILKLRKERNITQTELAGEASVSKTAVSAWETGGKCPVARRLTEMGRYFSVSIDFLCGKTNRLNYIRNTVTDKINLAKLNAAGIQAMCDCYRYLLTNDKFTT